MIEALLILICIASMATALLYGFNTPKPPLKDTEVQEAWRVVILAAGERSEILSNVGMTELAKEIENAIEVLNEEYFDAE